MSARSLNAFLRMMVFTAVLQAAGCAAPLKLPVDKVLIATYFVGDGRNGTYLAVSADGNRFDPLLTPNVPLLRPGPESDGLMRDAWLGQGPDGRWRMVWTIGRSERGIGYSESADLAHWSTPRVLEVGAGLGALNCWAPEVVFDPGRSEYVVFWASTVPGAFPGTAYSGDLRDADRHGARWNHRLYCTTTPDFAAFAPARLLCDPGFECIDPSMVRLDGTGPRWALLMKDETRTPPAKHIVYMVSNDPTRWDGPVMGPISGRSWAEGPTAVRVGGVWRVWWDCYMIDRWGAAQTGDWLSWADASWVTNMPEGAHHGTVLLVDRSTVEHLRESLAGSR